MNGEHKLLELFMKGAKYLFALAGGALLLSCQPDLSKIPPTGGPTVTLTASQTYGEAPLTVTFTVSAYPSRGDIQKVILDFGDGNSVELEMVGQQAVTQYTYESIGEFVATARVKDANGWAESSVTVRTNDRPRISNLQVMWMGRATNVVTPGSQITLVANCIDIASGIGQVVISWGDGTVDILSSCTAVHTFETEGTYTVKLWVFDRGFPQPLSSMASAVVIAKYGVPPADNPPSVRIRTSETIGVAPLDVTVTIGVFDAEGSVVRVVVDWGDGSATELADQHIVETREGRTIYKVEHTYTGTGVFRANVIAEDEGGNTTVSSFEVVTLTPAPVLAVSFKDMNGQDPNGKTYTINANDRSVQVDVMSQTTVYDELSFEIVYIVGVTFPAEGTQAILIAPVPHSAGVYEFGDSVECRGDGQGITCDADLHFGRFGLFERGTQAKISYKVSVVRLGKLGGISHGCVSSTAGDNFVPLLDSVDVWHADLAPCQDILGNLMSDPSFVARGVVFDVSK